MGVDGIAHDPAMQARGQGAGRFGIAGLAPFGRIDPRKADPPACLGDVAATQGVAVDCDGGDAKEEVRQK